MHKETSIWKVQLEKSPNTEKPINLKRKSSCFQELCPWNKKQAQTWNFENSKPDSDNLKNKNKSTISHHRTKTYYPKAVGEYGGL